ncbi:MAG TPA: hypothetical protein VFS43_43270 [Polyangiaceae bacterium]|nr:hypothetical protein [Polyangiaceae bacterium]
MRTFYPTLSICALVLASCAGDAGRPDADAGEPALDERAAQLDAAAAADEGTSPLAEGPSLSVVRPFPGGVHGMAVSGTGRLFFSDSFGNVSSTRRVYALDPPYTGAFAATKITGALPAGLLFDDGLLYVCDVAASRVRAFDAKLRGVKEWHPATPWGIARLPGGALVTVSNDGVVQRLEPDGAVTTLFGGLDAPFGIAAAADGTVWVSEQGVGAGRVTRRSLDGAVLETVAYPWDNPEGLLVDHQGVLWVAETGLRQLVRYDGSAATTFASNIGLPVVITRRDADTLLINSANLPAQLMALEESR